MAFLTYQEVLEAAGNGRKHLLLGNGFSIGCDARFRYDSLYAYAKEEGLSGRAQAVFERLGTNNFEGVLRALDDTAFVAEVYGLAPGAEPTPTITDDAEQIKRVLVSAVAGRHLDLPSDVPDEKKAACVEFLTPYYNVFTTNYDLLLYWVEMHGLDVLKGRDGFRAPPGNPDAPYLEFHERVGGEKGIFFLHGALHLYVANGEIRNSLGSELVRGSPRLFGMASPLANTPSSSQKVMLRKSATKSLETVTYPTCSASLNASKARSFCSVSLWVRATDTSATLLPTLVTSGTSSSAFTKRKARRRLTQSFEPANS